MSIGVLKFISMAAMLADHIGLLMNVSWLRVIGRIAFVLFAFFLSEGWQHTSNCEVYFKRLCMFALLSQIPYVYLVGTDVSMVNWLLVGTGIVLSLMPSTFFIGVLLYGMAFPEMNVMYTFAAAALWMSVMDDKRNISLFRSKRLWCALLVTLCVGFYCDYWFMGILLVCCYYGVRRAGVLGAVFVGTLWSALMYWFLSDSFLYFVGAMVGVMLLFFYDPGKGPTPLWFRKLSYWFYPVHMIVLSFLHVLIF